jgi:ActR/RegA family two-component response regulator
MRSPDVAVVDARLAPGSDRSVVRELSDRFGTTVLMATSETAQSLQAIGAQGVIPKPYNSTDIAPALRR